MIKNQKLHEDSIVYFGYLLPSESRWELFGNMNVRSEGLHFLPYHAKIWYEFFQISKFERRIHDEALEK